MEWIKAESGMPKNVSNHIFRQISSKTVLSASMVNDWVEDGYLQDLEWLDESASPEAVDDKDKEIERLKDGLRDCDALLAYFEDFTHGQDGGRITKERYSISKLI